jgi:pimeloyl-ACP methyl ester carboxylesterase
MHAQEKSDRRCRIFTFDYPEFGRSSGAASASPEAYSMNDLGSLLVHLLLHAEVGFLTSGTGHPHASNALTLVAHEVGALVAATAVRYVALYGLQTDC